MKTDGTNILLLTISALWSSSRWREVSHQVVVIDRFHCILCCSTVTDAEQKSEFVFTKDNPCLALTGELWGVYCEYFGENWPRYNGTALYMRLGVFSPPIALPMIVRKSILFVIIINQSKIRIIGHYLGLCHETMVCALCLGVFFPFRWWSDTILLQSKI